ncbi:1-acyl-sn-glycerol-3-phosphate acyltransferase [bacterium]|nr:1-acyl-sn-glycerol-3-phosphate acyltransferase [bacterium]
MERKRSGHWLAPAEYGQEIAYEAMRHAIAPVLRRMMAWIEATGTEHIPEVGPALLVSNHRSLLDPLLIALSLERHVHFVADSWLGHVALSRFLRAAGVIFLPSQVHRSHAMITQGAAALADGELLGIFPEGMDNFTAWTPPRAVGHFHTAFARLWWEVRDYAVPIVPVAIVGSPCERRLTVPAALVRAFDRGTSHIESPTVAAVFYESARIRFGEPLMLPTFKTEAEAVAGIVSRSRAAVAALMAG